MTYYNDDDEELLTYDEAERLVLRYFNQEEQRVITRVKHVLNEFGYEYSNHNIKRVIRALQMYCEPYERSKSGPQRFRIPERYQNRRD